MKNISNLQTFLASVKFKVISVIGATAFVMYLMFFILSQHSNEATQSVARQLYTDELKLIIADKYLSMINADTYLEKDREHLEKRFELFIGKGTVFSYVTEQHKNSSQNEKDAIREFQQVYQLAIEAKNSTNITELKQIYTDSLYIPSWDTYYYALNAISSGIARIQSDQQLMILTLLTTILVAFIILQVIAIRIGLIRKTTHLLTKDDKILDISQRVPFSSNDEMGDISYNLNTFFEHLEKIVSVANVSIRKMLYQTEKMYDSSGHWFKEVNLMKNSIDTISHQINVQITSVNQAASALEQMERTLDIIFKNISRQSAAMTQSAATIEEMGRQIESVTKIAEDTASYTTKLSEIADKGHQAVDSSIVSIRDVSEYSSQIIKLLKLITGIAKQTNLLAMNASIEAAHAGEAGRGFAIVAEEIRRLSETTNKNAKEIRTVVDTMVDKIENSVEQAQIAGTELQQINTYTGNVAEKTSQLNGMMQEQNSATHEMITTIEGLTNLAQEIKFSMEEQQHGLHEYSNTILTLKNNFNETKSMLDNHMSSVLSLLSVLQEAGVRIHISKEVTSDMFMFTDQFNFRSELKVSQEDLVKDQEQLFVLKKENSQKL